MLLPFWCSKLIEDISANFAECTMQGWQVAGSLCLNEQLRSRTCLPRRKAESLPLDHLGDTRNSTVRMNSIFVKYCFIFYKSVAFPTHLA